MVIAFPYEAIGMNHPPLTELAETNTQKQFNTEQLKYIDEYKKSIIKRYIGLLNNASYSDEYTESNKVKIDTAIGRHLKFKPAKEVEEIKQHSRKMLITDQQANERELKEFEFNDDLTLEENLRCFTGRNKDVYFTVMPKSLHYCYTIPMFDLQLNMRENILIIATRQ